MGWEARVRPEELAVVRNEAVRNLPAITPRRFGPSRPITVCICRMDRDAISSPPHSDEEYVQQTWTAVDVMARISSGFRVLGWRRQVAARSGSVAVDGDRTVLVVLP